MIPKIAIIVIKLKIISNLRVTSIINSLT